jgi:hypothetical protein
MNEILVVVAALVIPTAVTAFHTIRSITVTEETPASFAPVTEAHLNPTGAISISSHPTTADASTSQSISYEPTITSIGAKYSKIYDVISTSSHSSTTVLSTSQSISSGSTTTSIVASYNSKSTDVQYSVHPKAFLLDQLQLPSISTSSYSSTTVLCTSFPKAFILDQLQLPSQLVILQQLMS